MAGVGGGGGEGLPRGHRGKGRAGPRAAGTGAAPDPGLELGPGRCGIARCACGSSWPVLARQVHGTLPGVLAHELGVLICPSCGRTASLDATPAPVTDYDREG